MTRKVIIFDDPVDLPAAIARARKASGLTRWRVSEDIAAETGRSVHSVDIQACGWELGYRSPNLDSIEVYLRQHGWKLAIVSIRDNV